MHAFMKMATAAAFSAMAMTPPAGAAAMSRATLVQALEPSKTVVIDGKVWRCSGAECTASAAGSDQPLSRECARAVKVLGKVTAYVRDGKALDEAGLSACNASAG